MIIQFTREQASLSAIRELAERPLAADIEAGVDLTDRRMLWRTEHDEVKRIVYLIATRPNELDTFKTWISFDETEKKCQVCQCRREE